MADHVSGATTNYALPQYENGDWAALITGYDVAMDIIDKLIFEANTQIDALKKRMTKSEGRLDDHDEEIASLKKRCYTLELWESEMTTWQTTINNWKSQTDTNISNMQTTITNNYNKLDKKIDSSVTTLDKKIDDSVTNINQTIASLTNTVTQDNTKTNKTLAAIVAKFYGGGTIASDGSIMWGDSSVAALGNINIFSGDDGYIRTSSGTEVNDLKAV